MEDICSLIPKKEADVAILEEPEHLNWFRLPTKVGKNEENQDVDRLGWAHKFKHVVGVVSCVAEYTYTKHHIYT